MLSDNKEAILDLTVAIWIWFGVDISQFYYFTFGRCGYFVGITNNLLTDYWKNSRMGNNQCGLASGQRILEVRHYKLWIFQFRNNISNTIGTIMLINYSGTVLRAFG